MTTKTVTKELNLLDVEDIEAALSKHYDRKITVSEVECTLYYCFHLDTCELRGSYLEFMIGNDPCDSYDLWYDEEEKKVRVNGKRPSFVLECLRPEYIFNFDVSAFKEFECWVDNSD